jgi:CheY-like chemotaxis protein
MSEGQPAMEDLKYTILLVDDDENDVLLARMAFEKSGISNPIHWAKDGTDAVAYLQGEGIYADRKLHPFPELMILDLKMPRMTGLELLEWTDERPQNRVIPTIVMTSSRLEHDIEKAYDLGAHTYMVKPSSFEELVTMAKRAHEYWAVSVKPKAQRM